MSPLLEVRGLTKRYGGLTANANVVFDVNEGEIVVYGCRIGAVLEGKAKVDDGLIELSLLVM